MNNTTFSLRRRLQSFRWAFRGVGYVLKREHNAWIHLAATIIVLTLAYGLQVSGTEMVLLLISMCFVWVAEIINTAIEKCIDHVSPEWSIQAGLVKDIAAGAVLVAAIFAVACGLIIFIPKIL